MTDSIDVKQIMEKIRNQIMNNPTVEPINQNNIMSIASQKFKKRRAAIEKSNSNESEELQYLDSIISKTSNRFQNNFVNVSLDYKSENVESFEKELTEANLSYDIQTFEKIDTTKPKIIRNLVLKIRKMLQDEVRFALNPIVDKQIKFNFHLVRALTGLKIKHQLRMNKIERIAQGYFIDLKKLSDKIELKHQLRMDKIDLKRQITSDLVEGQHHAMEDLKTEILTLKIFRAYNQYLKRDPSDEDTKYWHKMIDSGLISRDALPDTIKDSEEAQTMQQMQLESVGTHSFSKDIVEKKIDGHIIYFNKHDKTYLEPFSHNQLYEEEVSTILNKLLKKGMNVINIGASIGYFTLLAARQVGPKGKVFAFEPFPGSLKLLEKNVEENGYKNVEIVPMAVSNKTGSSSLFLKSDSTQHFVSNSNQDYKKIKIAVTTIDDYFKEKNLKMNFVIMDAEGHENYILDGMRKTIEKNPHLEIIAEFNPYTLEIAGTTGKDFLDKIEKLGFSLHIIDDTNLNFHKATQNEILQITFPNTANLYLKKNH